MLNEIPNNNVLPHNTSSNRGLVNALTGKTATPEQAQEFFKLQTGGFQ